MNRQLLTVTETCQDSIDIASNTYHCTNCGFLNEAQIKEDFNEVDECLEKIVSMLKLLPQNKCEASKRQIINKIGGVQGVLVDETNAMSILEAVKTENINAVKNILRNANVDLEIKDENGNTALHIAAQLGDTLIVKLLLLRGANKRAKNKTLDVPLHIASQFGNSNIVTMFLENEVFIDIRNQFDCTPLHLASKNGKSEIVKILLKKGADYKIKNKDNKIAFEFCDDSEDVIKAFVDVTPNALSEEEKTYLLFKASEKNWLNLIESFIKSKVNLNCVYTNDCTPLMIGALNGHDQVVEIFLKCGANVNLQNNENRTALHYACLSGNFESVRLLIQYMAHLEAETYNLNTPIYSAVIIDNLQIVEYLLKNGANINVRDNDGDTLLHQCSINNSYTIAEWLLERGASVDDVNNKNKTPLSLACYYGSEQVVNVLLQRQAKVNFKCYKNQTPLHYACNHDVLECLNDEKLENYCNIIKTLLLHNADPTCKDKNELTPLDLAKKHKYQDIVSILENLSSKN